MPHFNAIKQISPQVIYRLKLDSLSYISAVGSSIVSSITFKQSVQKATEFGEITHRLQLLRRSDAAFFEILD